MKKIFVLVFMFCSYIANAQIEPKDTDGDGFRNVSTLDHLRWISENKSGWALNYKLENDINAADTKNWNDGKGWSPIGSATIPYRGVFDGHGYRIDNLQISRPEKDSIGFFGVAFPGATIKDLGITNCVVSGSGCVGSLVGCNRGGIVSNCYSTGIIDGGYEVGGLIGINIFGQVRYSYSNSKVSHGGCTGGLVGENQGTLQYCYSEGSVSGSSYTGGLAGFNGGYATCNNCYSLAEVKGWFENTGGLFGYIETNDISKCYSAGKVTATGTDYGGLVGKTFQCMAYACFWDIETSGTEISSSGRGKSTENMKTKSTFTVAGWDFENIWGLDLLINQGYPFLIEQATGINETEPEISQISISPNPASDLITISLQSSEDSDISIYNTLGEIVLSVGAENFLPTQIDISALPKGMYFLKIGDKMAKFVKM